MSGLPSPPVTSALTQAAALRDAFPEYVVNVRMGRQDTPQFEVVSRDGGDPYCLISSDAQEIWRELGGAAPSYPAASSRASSEAGSRAVTGSVLK
jgi:hypothetical protein